MTSSQYLLNKLTAFENVTLSMDIANVHQNDKELRAIELLEKVGLDQDQIHRRILKTFECSATKSGYSQSVYVKSSSALL